MGGGDQAGFGVVGGHVGDVLDVEPNEVVQRVQVGGGGGSERRLQSRSTPSEATSGSLWTCGPAPISAATPSVCHRPPDCTRGSQQKKENRFSLKGNGIMSSFLGRQFYRSTLYIYIYIEREREREKWQML